MCEKTQNTVNQRGSPSLSVQRFTGAPLCLKTDCLIVYVIELSLQASQAWTPAKPGPPKSHYSYLLARGIKTN